MIQEERENSTEARKKRDKYNITISKLNSEMKEQIKANELTMKRLNYEKEFYFPESIFF